MTLTPVNYPLTLTTYQQQQQNNTHISHVGPPKTASSTIQCGLAKYSRELAILDGYYYLRKPCVQYPLQNNETAVRGKFLEIELRQTKKAADQPAVQILQNRLTFHWGQGHHVIVSAENFHHGLLHPSGWKLLTHILLQHWQVRIVVTYRRVYDWLPSLFYQQFKKKPLASLLAFLQQGINDTTKTFQTFTFSIYINKAMLPQILSAKCFLRPVVSAGSSYNNNNSTRMQPMTSRRCAYASHISFDAHKLVSAAKARGLVSKNQSCTIAWSKSLRFGSSNFKYRTLPTTPNM